MADELIISLRAAYAGRQSPDFTRPLIDDAGLFARDVTAISLIRHASALARKQCRRYAHYAVTGASSWRLSRHAALIIFIPSAAAPPGA